MQTNHIFYVVAPALYIRGRRIADSADGNMNDYCMVSWIHRTAYLPVTSFGGNAENSSNKLNKSTAQCTGTRNIFIFVERRWCDARRQNWKEYKKSYRNSFSCWQRHNRMVHTRRQVRHRLQFTSAGVVSLWRAGAVSRLSFIRTWKLKI